MTDNSTHAYAERIDDHMPLELYHGPRPTHVRPPRPHRRRCALALGVLLLVAAVPAAAEEAPVQVEVARTIAASAREVRAVLLDLERFGAWFPALAEWRVLARTVEGARVYGRQALPWPVDDRDYVVEYQWLEDGDGAFILDAVAQGSAAPAPTKGVVRLERMHSRWTVRGAARGTHVTYRYESESGGTLPPWVARLGWRARTGAVIDGLVAEIVRRRARPGAPAP